MKKRIIMVGGVIVLISAIVGALIYFNHKGEDDKVLELTYTINAGIPYKWEVEIEDETVVKLDKTYVVEDKNKNGMTGAPISTNYVFKGIKEGNTVVKFKFVNITNNKVEREETNNIKVDKDNKVTLVGQYQ